MLRTTNSAPSSKASPTSPVYSALFNDVAPHLTGIRKDFVDALLIEIGVKQHRAAASKKTTKGNESAARLDKPRPKREQERDRAQYLQPRDSATRPKRRRFRSPRTRRFGLGGVRELLRRDRLARKTTYRATTKRRSGRRQQGDATEGGARPAWHRAPDQPEFDDKPTAAGVTLARTTQAPLATPSSAGPVAPPAAPANTSRTCRPTPGRYRHTNGWGAGGGGNSQRTVGASQTDPTRLDQGRWRNRHRFPRVCRASRRFTDPGFRRRLRKKLHRLQRMGGRSLCRSRQKNNTVTSASAGHVTGGDRGGTALRGRWSCRFQPPAVEPRMFRRLLRIRRQLHRGTLRAAARG